MILIQHYVTNQLYVSTLTNAQVQALRAEHNLPISRDGDSHWIAEPSAIKYLSEHCAATGHYFEEVSRK